MGNSYVHGVVEHAVRRGGPVKILDTFFKGVGKKKRRT
jgi:hypothetical protein